MIIKGWKKITDSNTLKVYEKIDESRKQLVVGSPKTGRAIVELYLHSDAIWTKTFTSHKQALKFAVAYMKQHPNG